MFYRLMQLEYGLALAIASLEEKAGTTLQKEEVREWLKAIVFAVAALVLFTLTRHALASDGTEFQQAADTFEGWAKGNPGKIAAILGVLWGSAQAIFKKDLGAFATPAGIGVGVGVILGVIDSTYTATI